MKRYLLDTNVLLRFLLADHKTLTPRANALFASAAVGECEIVLTDVALAEAVWVLTSHYRVARERVAETLSDLLSREGIACEHRGELTDALSRFGKSKVDFFDCYLAAKANSLGYAVASFDRDLKRFDDTEVWDGK